MEERFPALFVNTNAICTNAKVFCKVCASYGISVAGVIKFSDGAPEIGRAYAAGGCAQIAVSRAIHLPALKRELPDVETLLTEHLPNAIWNILPAMRILFCTPMQTGFARWMRKRQNGELLPGSF